MKSFSYIAAKPYKGNYARLPMWLDTPPREQAPQFAGISMLIPWADYGGSVLGAGCGVGFNLRGTNVPPIRRIAAAYIDNSFNSLPVYAVFPDTGYMLLAQAYAVGCWPVFSLELQGTIYCEDFDGILIPSTRLIFMDRFLATWNIAPPSTPVITNPSIVTTSHGNNGGNTTTTNATLPATIVSGNLLLLFVSISGTANTCNTPAGWTLKATQVSGFGTFGNVLYIFSKVASGSEGATVALTHSNTTLSYAAEQIKDYTQGPQVTTNTTAGASLIAPTITPAWGSATDLIIAVGAAVDLFTVTPAGYTVDITENGTSNALPIKVCSLLKTVVAETPGTFTVGSASGITAATLAVANI